MPRLPHRFQRLVAHLGLLISLLALADLPAQADPPVVSSSTAQPVKSAPIAIENLPPGTILAPGTIGPAPTGTQPPGVSASPALDPTDDYWIVSSRHCDGKGAGNLGCMQFFQRASGRELRDAGRDAFLASIRPEVPVCFIVHGSYNWWRDVVTESRKINRWIRSADRESPVQVVFFTWPSDGNMPFLFPVDIAVLGRKASQHSVYLANLIGQLPPDQPVCLLGHSHGARASVAALHLLAGGAVEDGHVLPPGYSTPRRLRAVLIAAAIDHNWLNPGQRYGRALVIPEQVLLMRNSRDATLAIYPLRKAWGERAMGRDGVGTQNRFAMDAMGKKIVELDAAQFAGSYHSFADYHEHPELASAAIPYVYFRDEHGAARPLGPAVPTPTVNEPPDLGDPQPIQPARRNATSEPPVEGKPVSGPKFTPSSLVGEPDLESEETRAGDSPRIPEPFLAKGERNVKILPRTRSAARDAAGAVLPRDKGGPVGVKKRNPFQLRVEP